MSISHYKNAVFITALMSTTFVFNVACVRAASSTSNANHVNTMSSQPKPVAGRNRRRASTSRPSLSYPRAKTDYLNVSVGTSKLRINVLANDDGNYLQLSGANDRSAKGGRVYIKNNKILYVPPKGYEGRDSFWYTVKDRSGRRHSAKVIVCFCS